MEQLQSWFDLAYNAVNEAYQSGNWDKFAAWGVYTAAFCYGAFFAAKKGLSVAWGTVKVAGRVTRGMYRFVNPLPPVPPKPSRLCEYLLDALSYENMVFDSKLSQFTCGPVCVRLVKETDTITEITVDKEDPWDHLVELDRGRIRNRVKFLVQTYHDVKNRDTAQRMMNKIHCFVHQEGPLVISHPCANSDLSPVLVGSGCAERHPKDEFWYADGSKKNRA